MTKYAKNKRSGKVYQVLEGEPYGNPALVYLHDEGLNRTYPKNKSNFKRDYEEVEAMSMEVHVTREQFECFRKVQSSGQFNMLTVGAVSATNLPVNVYDAIINNYEKWDSLYKDDVERTSFRVTLQLTQEQIERYRKRAVEQGHVRSSRQAAWKELDTAAAIRFYFEHKYNKG